MTPELTLTSLDGLLPAIAAIDRLNSWVRSKSYRMHATCARDAVYDLKRRALVAAQEAGLCEHRRIRTVVKCRNCGGSGSWDGWGRECYSCDGCGSVILTFLETTLNGWFCWHTPFRNLFAIHRGLWEQFSEERGETVTDWQPNQTGRDLSPVEVADAFNTAEAYFPGGRDYRLYLGVTPGGCQRCGHQFAEGEEPVRVSLDRCALVWDICFCRPCVEERTWYALKLCYDATRPDESLLSPPEIRQWMLRHRVAM